MTLILLKSRNLNYVYLGLCMPEITLNAGLAQ